MLTLTILRQSVLIRPAEAASHCDLSCGYVVNTATKWRHKRLALVVPSINAAVYYLSYRQNPILYQYPVEVRVLNVALPYFVVLKSMWNLATRLQLETKN